MSVTVQFLWNARHAAERKGVVRGNPSVYTCKNAIRTAGYEKFRRLRPSDNMFTITTEDDKETVKIRITQVLGNHKINVHAW
jgi:hypothetical protein